ncbi:MAG: fibronectin type III domain-containing protein [Bacteroidales bacterium]|nr:fibronectin type III domain-containing protein [Bacteroidales bacterium]MBQ6822147.1 fibronectin type III domain-containing protein [Bacteroidales bacterium]MBR0083563.1 fibronectin type III domain-containing protein [Bacteroidales bacterium]MBR0291416.1 fibronectin type III domain-containing protein [Bacteroidales bacterium]
MKSNKIFTFAACLLALAACKKENPYQQIPGGLDASKPAVATFNYDEATSGAKVAGFTWDAAQAVAAGATSYTIELTQDVSINDVINGTSVTIVEVPETAAVISKDIKAGDFYYARIRANYPGYFYSNWTYLGSASSPMAVCVGTGVVDAKFGAPASLTTSNVAETGFKATWTSVAFAESYVFEYKPASSGEWEKVPTAATTYDVEGLVGKTTYDIRVKAVKGEEESEYTTASVTTLEPSKFNPAMSKVSDLVEFLQSEAVLASSSSEYTLEADIDLTGVTIPAAESFKGTLDGKGHSIKGLKSGKPIFNTLSGTVKNLVIDASCAFSPEVPFFGIIAGDNQGTISACTNKAAISFTADAVAEPMLVAAFAGQSSGSIAGCTNEGAVSVAVNGPTVAVGTAGIVGYQKAEISDCVNKGAISFTAKNITGKVTVVEATGALPTIGGVCGYGAPGFQMSGCDNYGKITYAVSAADVDLTANLNRNQIAGVVGSPCGTVSNCKNFGEISASLKHSTPGTDLLYEFILHVGGIGGGDYQFTNTSETFSNTSYINCVNEGNIIVDSDASKSNSAIGGIVGWPGQEKPVTGTSVSGCLNKGNITCKGVLKCRVAGIEGGTGVVENSENQGVITIESANVGSAIGSLCGFHSQGHAITGSTAGGEVVTKCKITGGTGALIGNIGNAAHSNISGNKVNCKITVSEYDATTTGFIVGKWNGSSKEIVIGSPDAIQVSGTLNGNPASADNMWGTANYTAGTHTVTFNIK